MARRSPVKDGPPREPVQTRVSPALIEKLKASCEASGRSMAQEVELRLERSFDADLIQKAVADGIAAHEAAKREELMKRVTVHSSGVYGVNQSISSGNSYLSLYGLQGTQNS